MEVLPSEKDSAIRSHSLARAGCFLPDHARTRPVPSKKSTICETGSLTANIYGIQTMQNSQTASMEDDAMTAKFSRAGLSNSSTTTLSIWKIERGGTESRAAINRERVAHYATILDETGYLDPIVIFRDDEGKNWIGDGHHRWHAHQQRGIDQIMCEIASGTQRDAILFGIQINARHGAERSSADIAENLRRLLTDPEWSKWTDREIARIAGVSHQTVGRRRQELKTASGPLDRSRNLQSDKDLVQREPEMRKSRRGKTECTVRVPSAAGMPTLEEIENADAEIEKEMKAKKQAPKMVRCPKCRGTGKVASA